MNIRTSAIRGLAILSLGTFALAACDKKDEIIIPPTPAPAVEVVVTPTAVTLEVGQTAQAGAVVKNVPTGGNTGVTWSSSDATVASVDANGKITAVKAGNALITATSAADATAKGQVSVTVTAPVITLAMLPSTGSIAVGGGTLQLVTTVNGSTNKTVTCVSSATGVATVTANTTGCLVTPVAAGTAVITATSAADPNKTAQSVITVTPVVSNVAITLLPATFSVAPGGTQQLTATVTGTTNTGVTYASSNANVATVSTGGLVTGVAPGVTVITATSQADPTKIATAQVTVNAYPAVVVSVSPTTVSIAPGATQQLSTVITGGNNASAAGATYTSTNPNVATVSSTGLITAVASGTTTVTVASVQDPSKTQQVTVTVAAVTQPSVSIQNVTVGGVPQAPNANVAGVVTVTMNVSAGSLTNIDSVAVQANGVTACVQKFSPPLAPTQGVATITCPINTAQLKADGTPLFPNDFYNITAVAFSSNVAAATATWGRLGFANANVMTLGITTTGVSDADGQAVGGNAGDATLWREGNVVVTLTPTLFNGQTLSSATLCAVIPVGATAAPGSATGTSCKTITSSTNNVFTATFNKSAVVGGATNGVANVSNSAVEAELQASLYSTSLNGPTNTVGPTIQLDNLAPAAPVLVATLGPAANNNWLTAAFAFNTANVIGAAGVDPAPGVNTVTYTYYYLANTPANAALTATQQVAAGTAVTSAAAIPPSNTNTEYLLVVRATDALGNTVDTKWAGTFGVDQSIPTFTLATAPAPTTVNPTVDYTFTFTDDRSGFTGTPLWVRIIRYQATTTRCVDENTNVVTTVPAGGCAFVNSADNTVVVPQGAGDGYYEITVKVQDRAGNFSTEDTRIFLIDGTNPAIVVNSFGVAGTTISIDATITDNVGLRGWDWRTQFAGAVAPTGAVDASLPMGPLTVVGSYGVANRTASAAAVGSITPWRSLTVTAALDALAGAVTTQASGAGVGAFDVARNYNSSYVASAQAGNAIPAGLANFGIASSGAAVCNGVAVPAGEAGTACAAGRPSSRTLTATATGPTGTFVQPFTAVNFYAVAPNGAVWYLGQNAGSPTTIEQTSPTVNRLYTWSFTFDGTQFPGGVYNVFALGINGRDVVRSATVAITVEGSPFIP